MCVCVCVCVLHAIELALTPVDPVNDDIHVLFSTALLSSWRLTPNGFLYGVNPSHIWFSSFPAAFSFEEASQRYQWLTQGHPAEQG